MPKAAIIIHTRTKHCDYPSVLTVTPEGLASKTASSMRKAILAATRSIDSLENNAVRRVIFSTDGWVMAGMVAFLKHLADGSPDDENLFTDEKGRSIYAFTGLVFQAGQEAPQIDKAALWEGFKKYMSPVWERTTLDLQSAPFADTTALTTASEPHGEQTAGGMTFYTVSGSDSEVFDYYLTQAAQGKDISFCSNIVDFRVIKDRAFNIITTAPNLIERAERELTEPQPAEQETAPGDKQPNIIPAEPNTSRRKTILIIISILLALILLAALVIHQHQKYSNTQQPSPQPSAQPSQQIPSESRDPNPPDIPQNAASQLQSFNYGSADLDAQFRPRAI